MPSITRRRLSAVGAVLALASMQGAATTIFKFRVEKLAAAGGRVAFIANGLALLDSNTGRIILREPGVSYAQLDERPDGLVVATPLRFRRAMRMRLFSTRADPAWDVTCDLWHLGQRFMICVDAWSWRRITIEARSLGDGRIRWTYDTGGVGGEALDAKGRLMITNEDVTQESSEHGTFDVARATTLTVLDIETGRVLAETALPNLRLYGWSGVWPPNHEFDGDRVLFRVRPKAGCNGTDVYVYTLDAAAAVFTSSVEECRATEQPQPNEAVWTEAEKSLGPKLYPLTEGAVATFELGGAALVERRSATAQWQAFMPATWEPEQRLQVQRVFEGDGTVFVQSSDWTFGTVDALGLATGRPLWRYVFPSRGMFGSIGVFGTPDPPSPSAMESQWRALISNPPAPLSRVQRARPIDDFLNPAEPVQPLEGPSSVVFDPAAIPQFRAMRRWLLERWTAIALGAVFVFVPFGRRFAPARSMRRVGLAFARFLYLAGVLLFGVPSLLAAVAMRLLLLIAFAQTMLAALRVRTERSWLVPAALMVALLLIGAFLLTLL